MKKILFSESQRNRILGEAQGYVESTYEVSAKLLRRSYQVMKQLAQYGYTKNVVMSTAEQMGENGGEKIVHDVEFTGKSLGWPYSDKINVYYVIMSPLRHGGFDSSQTKIKDSKFNITSISIVINIHSLYTIPKEKMQSIVAHELSHAYNEIRTIQKNKSEFAGMRTTNKDNSFLENIKDEFVNSFFYLLSPEEERACISQLMTDLLSLDKKGMLSNGHVYQTVFDENNTRVGNVLERYDEWIEILSTDNVMSQKIVRGLVNAYYETLWNSSTISQYGKKPIPSVRKRHGNINFLTNYRKRILSTLMAKRDHLIKKAKQVIDSYFIRKTQK